VTEVHKIIQTHTTKPTFNTVKTRSNHYRQNAANLSFGKAPSSNRPNTNFTFYWRGKERSSWRWRSGKASDAGFPPLPRKVGLLSRQAYATDVINSHYRRIIQIFYRSSRTGALKSERLRGPNGSRTKFKPRVTEFCYTNKTSYKAYLYI
jgi:hypothetical protein